MSPVVALLSHGDNEQGVCTMNMALSPSWSPNVPSFGANRRAGDAPSGLPSPAVTMVSPPSKATPKNSSFWPKQPNGSIPACYIEVWWKTGPKSSILVPPPRATEIFGLSGPARNSRLLFLSPSIYFCPQTTALAAQGMACAPRCLHLLWGAAACRAPRGTQPPGHLPFFSPERLFCPPNLGTTIRTAGGHRGVAGGVEGGTTRCPPPAQRPCRYRGQGARGG